MSSFMFDGLHRGLGQVLDLRMSQHTLTATNLANADTPGFKAKFIPFDRILSEVVDQSSHLVRPRLDQLRELVHHAVCPAKK